MSFEWAHACCFSQNWAIENFYKKIFKNAWLFDSLISLMIRSSLALISLFEVKDNFFITISDFNGRCLVKLTAGVAGFVGPKKGKVFTCKRIAFLAAKRLKRLKFRIVVVTVRGGITVKSSAAIGTLLKVLPLRGKSRFIMFAYKPLVAHNGTRLQKERRV